MLQSEIKREFKTFSNVNNNLSQSFAKLFNNKEKNKELSFDFPEDVGKGRSSKIILNKNLEIYRNSIKCNKDIELGGKTSGEVYMLAICTGENIEWLEYNSKKYLELKAGEAILYKINDIFEVCQYKKNHYYAGITILINSDVFSDYFNPCSINDNIFNKDYKNFKINKFMLQPEGRIVTEQIINCPYKNSIRAMYLEGKILELFSICLNGIIEKDVDHIENIKLSKTEIESIYKAKEILENYIDCSITIPQLSKLIYLNEYKLKTGFKKVFGKPVYTYQLDKRMELAREFLTINHYDVKEVADRVGYANSSSFSKAFRKKYGINPSQYI